MAGVIGKGGVIAFRTDTFYGLGADPFNRRAVQRIKQLKGRDDQKPILIVISDQSQLDLFIVARTPGFNLLAEKFWPGPLTLIGKAASELPEEITAGTGTVGVRWPTDQQVRTLIEACGGGLTATSANPTNQSPAKTARVVEKYFGEQLDLIVDGGEAVTDEPSTVIDTTGTVSLIREGVLSWSRIESALSEAHAKTQRRKE